MAAQKQKREMSKKNTNNQKYNAVPLIIFSEVTYTCYNP